MIPQDDSYPETIEAAISALLSDGAAAGRAALEEIAYPVREVQSRPAISRAQAARIYLRDHFICRYCGGRTILTAVMELLATIYPDIFPFHRNWKGGVTHPAVITRSAVVDHIDPGAWGGDWRADANLVTACWPCNSRKGDLTLAQLGWHVRSINTTDWDGVTGDYGRLWNLAGRPNERLHRAWMTCLNLPAPE